MPRVRQATSILPLKPVVFLVLLVLSEGEAHGYRIRKDVERRSDGNIRMDSGTLYRLINRLIEDRLIEKSDAPPKDGPEDSRRRYYRLPKLGREVLRSEAKRLQALVSDSRAAGVLEAASPPAAKPGTGGPTPDGQPEYRDLVESSPDLIWEIDGQARWTFVNGACRSLYGTPASDLLGKPFIDLAAPERRDADSAFIESVLDGAAETDYETVHIDRLGRSRHLSFSAQPVRDGADRVVGARGTARDVTQQVANRQAIEQARDEALRATSAKSAFLANMSHEIRTPMSGVLGMTELLLGTELTPDQVRSVELVQTSARSLLPILNDILDFSKIEAGHMSLEEVPFDLHQLVTNVVRVVGAAAYSRKVELTCDIPREVPRKMLGDPSRLRQILTNLVSNAIRFTSEGEVSVVVTLTEMAGDGARLAFSVRDTGRGIPPDRLHAIFEEFLQAEQSTARDFGGTGLGLPISLRLVRLMGGELDVTSQLGRGSTFSFELTLRMDTEADDGPSTRYASIEDKHILVVDDNPTSRRIVFDILEDAGARVHECDNVDVGLAAMRETVAAGAPFDLAVVDGYMPDRDGFDLAEEVQAEPDLQQTRVMLLTSAGQRGDGQRARSLGISAYLTKPVSSMDLLESVATVLGRPAGGAFPDLVTRHSIQESRHHLAILLAEDNPVNQQVAASILSKRGHSVDVVDNGREAIDALRTKIYDVVLMDVRMPILDGLAATAEIRQHHDFRDLPIIAITAHVLPKERRQCMEVGMNGFVTKPFSPHELFAVVEGWASRAVPTLEATQLPKPPPGVIVVPGSPFDLKGFRQMMREAGVEDMVEATLSVYLRDTPERIRLLTQAVAEHHADEIEAVAHSLKSASGSIRAEALAELLAHMEIIGKDRTLDPAPDLLQEILIEYETVSRILRDVADDGR
ncbi:MAG: response regulator [Gemmatimonadetes bacterium]|nr:response regulator [Gemmatimonadota bacterium]